MHRSALDWHWLASVHLKVGQIGVQPDFKEFMKLLSHHVCSVCSSTRNTKHGIRDACSTADCCPLLSIVFHWYPLLSIVVHCYPLLSNVIHCCPLLSIVIHLCILLLSTADIIDCLWMALLLELLEYCSVCSD